MNEFVVFAVELEIKNAYRQNKNFGTIAKTLKGLLGQICGACACVCVCKWFFVAGAMSEQMTNGIN